MEIKILGTGCAKCERAARAVSEAVKEAGVEAQVVKVTDALEIAASGVFGTPAVIVDGQVKSVGKVPEKAAVVSWLKGEA